jgi:hypothetical protein
MNEDHLFGADAHDPKRGAVEACFRHVWVKQKITGPKSSNICPTTRTPTPKGEARPGFDLF